MNSTPSTGPFIFHKGELIPADRPVLGVADGAFIMGHGLFETIAAYRGIPFDLEAHVARLQEGGERLQLEVPELPAIRDIFDKLIEANGLGEVPQIRLRLTVTNRAGAVYEATPAPSHRRVARVATVPYLRNERSALTGLKTISYGENAVAIPITNQLGADEGLWANSQGMLCEGTWSNVFVRLAGRWKTPPLTSGCLPGVTRARVLSLAAEAGIGIDEELVPMDALTEVEAAFLTSSLREIQPVSSINGRMLDGETPPEVDALKEAYREISTGRGKG